MSDTTKSSWTKVAFGDVVRQVKDKIDPLLSGLERYIAGEHMDTDDLSIRRWGLIGDDYLGPAFHMRFKPGQVLYGSRRTYLRKVALPHFEGITANTTFVLESKDPKVLLPELLPFIMQTEQFHAHSIEQSKGSVNPYVNFSDLKWYEFELPPLYKQKELIRLFRGVQKVQNKLTDTLSILDTLRLAFCQHVLNETCFTKNYFSSIAKLKSGKGIAVSNLLKHTSVTAKIPVYGGNGIAGFTTEQLDDVPVPAVVIGRVGEYCGAVHYTETSSWVSDNAMYIQEIYDEFIPKYLAICLQGAQLSKKSTGGAQPLINQKIVGSIQIPNADSDSQKRTIEYFNQIEERQKNITSRQNELINMGKVIFAFAGDQHEKQI